jgi:alkylhydroperoxidase family enzyme
VSEASERVTAAVLGRHGRASLLDRQAALRHGASGVDGVRPELAPLVGKVTLHAYRVTDEDVQSALDRGCSEEELFDVIVAAALGAGLARREAGLGALERWERHAA